MTMQELSPDERALVESGAATLTEILDAKRHLADAWLDEQIEAMRQREYDRTHCPVCGADINADPGHCT